MEVDLLSNESFGNGIAIRLQVHIASHIDDPVMGLINRGDIDRKGVHMGLFDEIGGFSTHPQ